MNKRVESYENLEAGGYVLCDQQFFDQHVEDVKALRERQAAYLDSLPSDPVEAIRAAKKLLHPGGDEYPGGLEEALNLSVALEALAKFDGCEPATSAATAYIAQRVVSLLQDTTRQIDQISDILGSPLRQKQG